MRISTPTPGQMVDEAGYLVYVDDQRIIGCVCADEEAGTAIILNCDENGHIRTTEGHITHRKVSGMVKIYELRDKATICVS